MPGPTDKDLRDLRAGLHSGANAPPASHEAGTGEAAIHAALAGESGASQVQVGAVAAAGQQGATPLRVGQFGALANLSGGLTVRPGGCFPEGSPAALALFARLEAERKAAMKAEGYDDLSAQQAQIQQAIAKIDAARADVSGLGLVLGGLGSILTGGTATAAFLAIQAAKQAASAGDAEKAIQSLLEANQEIAVKMDAIAARHPQLIPVGVTMRCYAYDDRGAKHVISETPGTYDPQMGPTGRTSAAHQGAITLALLFAVA